MIRNKSRDAAVYGVDLGKNVFHVIGTDAVGRVIQAAKFRREALLTFFERAAPALVGMEACVGFQWLARKLRAECLNTHWFMGLDDAQVKMKDWRRDYNSVSLHPSFYVSDANRHY